jgi:peroxiredoxin Q/BCP
MFFRSNPLAVGDEAPEFTLEDQDGNEVSLSELLAKGPLVLFFYPKAFTPVCTAEACGFRDDLSQFNEAGASVVGISTDSVETQKKFHSQHKLTYPLLSDPRAKVYGKFGLRASTKAALVNDRVTFVIDRDGIVRHHASGMFAADPHVQESLEIAKTLS